VALVLDEREEISRGIAAGRSIRRIAASLGRSPSTVSREVARHGGRSSYRAIEADARAWELALRPKRCRLASHPELRWRVAEKLALDWSPEQISGWLKRAFPADKGLRVSHETIYPRCGERTLPMWFLHLANRCANCLCSCADH
jgi:IS30 family transposase